MEFLITGSVNAADLTKIKHSVNPEGWRQKVPSAFSCLCLSLSATCIQPVCPCANSYPSRRHPPGPQVYRLRTNWDFFFFFLAHKPALIKQCQILWCSWTWAARLCSALHRQGGTSPALHCDSSGSPPRDSTLINFHSLCFHLFSTLHWPFCKRLNKALKTLEAIALIVSVHHCIDLSQWIVVLCSHVCVFVSGTDPTHLALLWTLELFFFVKSMRKLHTAPNVTALCCLMQQQDNIQSFMTIPFPRWFVEAHLGAGPEDRLSWFSPKPWADRILFPPVLCYRRMAS